MMYMSRSRALKVQVTAGSVKNGRMDRISMKKEAGETLDAQLKNSRCVVGGTAFSHLARGRVRDGMSRSFPKLNSSWSRVLYSISSRSNSIISSKTMTAIA